METVANVDFVDLIRCNMNCGKEEERATAEST